MAMSRLASTAGVSLSLLACPALKAQTQAADSLYTFSLSAGQLALCCGLPAALLAGAGFLVWRRLAGEKRRARREALLRTVTGEGVWEYDPKRSEIVFDARCADLFQEQKFSGALGCEALNERIFAGDRQAGENALRLREQVAKGAVLLEFRLARNPEVWLRLSGKSLEAEGKVLGTLSDVSALKKRERIAEESLRHLQRAMELLSQVQRIAKIGTWEYDVASRRIVFSKELYPLLDAKVGELVLEPEILEFFLAPASQAPVRNALTHALGKGQPVDLEIAICTRAGRQARLRCTASAEMREGRVTRLFGAVQDVTALHADGGTEPRDFRRRVIEMQRLESMGSLAGCLAHDFNNLLTVILSNASLAKLDVRASSPIDGLLTQIETASMQAAGLCKQMLVYSGHYGTEVAQVDVNALVAEMKGLLDLAMGKKGKLALEVGETTGATLVDKAQLRQIILALVQNASESCTHGKGSVAVSCGLTELDDEDVASFKPFYEVKPGSFVRIEVQDNGCGMDEATRQRIFEPFFSTKFPGRGIGLTAVSEIVRAHRGAISVESVPSKGTVVRILLPSNLPKAPAGPVARVRSSAVRGINTQRSRLVLVADDDEAVRNTIVNMLKRHSIEVLTAANGKQACELFEQHSGIIWGVMLDLNMPVRGGLEALDEIRRRKASVPVILMTGEDDTSLNHGNGDPLLFKLQKPFSVTALAHCLEQVTQIPR